MPDPVNFDFSGLAESRLPKREVWILILSIHEDHRTFESRQLEKARNAHNHPLFLH